MRGWVIFILWVLLGAGVLCWSIVLGFRTYDFRNDAIILTGTISAIRWSDSDGALLSRPVVKVILPDGESREYKSRFSSSTTSYSVGQQIEVLWDPESKKIRLNSFGDLYFPAIFVLAVALFILFGPVFCIAVLIWIWGWPTGTNFAKMRAALNRERQ